MTVTSILQPGQMETAAGDIPELRLPPGTLFGDRARRLRRLAEGHSLGDYLSFLAALATSQQDALDRHPEILLPDAGLIARCFEYQMPPLSAASRHRHPHWRDVARKLAETVQETVPAEGREAFALLLTPDNTAWLEVQADHLLAGQMAHLNLATAPLVGAALQVQWTHLASRLAPEQVAREGQPALCPVCGSHPVASVIRTDGATHGLRYLQCALCGSEWHLVRSKCSNCETTQAVTYYSIAGSGDIVRAEACPACRTYLKVMHPEKDPQVDPVADDLATLGLDLLMGEKDFGKSGINFLMIPGTEE